MARFTGFYVAGEIITTFSVRGPGGSSVSIPGLTGPAAFPFIFSSGRSEGEFLNIAQNVDQAMTVGADGEAVASITYNKSGNIVVTVMEGSLLNVAFSLAYKALTNQSLPSKFVIGCTIVDPNSPGTLINAPQCILSRSADVAYDATPGTKTWTLLAAELENNHGARVF